MLLYNKKDKDKDKIEKIVIDIDNLNVRADGSYYSNIVETCKPDTYKVLDRKNGFVKIGEGKWVAEKFGKIIKEKEEKEEEPTPIIEDTQIEDVEVGDKDE